MSHAALGPLLYTELNGHRAALEVSCIRTIVRSRSGAGRSEIQLRDAGPVEALEPPMLLFGRWVEVLAFAVPRDPATFPGYADAPEEPEP